MAEPEPILPFQRHSETSRQAAIQGIPRVGTARRRVLDYIAAQGATGATDDEVQRGLPMNPSTQRPRRIELEKAGLVRKIDATRTTQWGEQAAVYVTTAKVQEKTQA